MALATNDNSLPLLPSEAQCGNYMQDKACLLVLWILKIIMWAIFVGWISLFYLLPSGFGADLYDLWVDATSGSLFGKTGSALLLYDGPILIIAFLAVPYLLLSPNEDSGQLQEKEKNESPRFRFRTFPVLINGIFGVVSAAELIGIILFLLFVLWATYIHTIRNFERLPQVPSYATLTPAEKGSYMLQMSALSFGSMALSCLAFLFLPVARGSILLRLINIPFEHAARYHIWLGHLVMFLLSLHGVFYIIFWTMRGILLKSILQWRNDGIANLAGAICYGFGLVLWVTTLPIVRKKYFELFFYTHQLYILFIIFMALHVGSTYFSSVVGGIFLFMLDHFLRFCQSQRTVSIISTSNFSCGFVKIILSKPQNLQYNALSFIFLRVQGLSSLQWHPFSVSSSPLDGKYHISILIKDVGSWTSKLRKRIGGILVEESHPEITASVEGPYGHESPYHLSYENLVLIAGGSGISPFLAIMADIFHRVKERQSHLPRNIILLWVVKKSVELSLLHTIDMESIDPSLTDRFSLEIQVYVTQELETPSDEGGSNVTMSSSIFPISKGHNMSVLLGTGSKIWSGVYVISSTLGFIIILGLLDALYINPFSITSSWYLGLLLVVCMVFSVIIFGGLVIYLWHLREERYSNTRVTGTCEEGLEIVDTEYQTEQVDMASKDFIQEKLRILNSIEYGHRPNFKEIFGSLSKRWGYANIGVIVCGPSTLESSVAKECRSQNLSRNCNMPIFHFHSHSFHL